MKRIWLNEFYEHDKGFTPGLNMGYLNAALKKIPETEIKINFYKFNEIDQAVAEAVEIAPTIVGLSVLQNNNQASIEFSNKLKEKLPSVHITMGNSFASTYPSYLLEKYFSIDSIVIGEGEFSLVELCTCIINEIPLNACKGIYYRDKMTCKVESELHDTSPKGEGLKIDS